MANHFRLFGRPLSADVVELGLSVTGVLEGYTSGEAYESRLDINNPVGRCKVEVLESTLPPGTAIRVDNITKEVVVKWDAYTPPVETETIAPNGDFENGDDGTWVYGPGGGGQGWSIGTGPEYDTYSGAFSARFANYKGGSDINMVPVPAKINDYIKAKAMVQQGGSSDGKAAGSIHMTFSDANHVPITSIAGNNVRSGKDGNWSASEVEGGAPAGTAFVHLTVSAYRNKGNHPLWVDQVTWDHKYTLGQEGDDEYRLRIKVTDSANRVAYWEGTVEEYGVFFTSKPYPVITVESGGFSAATSFYVRDQPEGFGFDLGSVGAAVTFTLRDQTQQGYAEDYGSVSATFDMTMREPLRTTATTETGSVSGAISVLLKDQILTTQAPELGSVSATIGVTLA